MCLFPKLIKNPKYKPNKKNGGQVPAVTDPRVLYVPIGCNSCIECSKAKANNWRVRLMEDLKQHRNAIFVTLTFSDKSYTQLAKEFQTKGYALDNDIAKRAVHKFLNRWRKKHKRSIRHWLVTELGHHGTENIHLHGLLWTDHRDDIPKIWQYGYVFMGTYVNERTISYIIKYTTKVDPKHKHYKPMVLTSPGIGGNFIKSPNAKLNTFRENDTNTLYQSRSGTKHQLPIYYRNKLYNDDQKEKLWLQKLDENTRYVLGTKIAADDKEEYLRALKWARKLNIEQGYLNHKDYDQRKYEEQLREINQNKRFDKYNKNNNNNNNNKDTN